MMHGNGTIRNAREGRNGEHRKKKMLRNLREGRTSTCRTRGKKILGCNPSDALNAEKRDKRP